MFRAPPIHCTGTLVVALLIFTGCAQPARISASNTSAQPQLSSARVSTPSAEEMNRTRGTGWEMASSGDSGNVFFVHLPSLERSEASVSGWVMINFWEGQRALDGFFYRSQITRREFDCLGRRTRTHDLQIFSDRGGAGLSRNLPGRPSDWSAVAPGSVAEDVWEVACRNAPRLRVRASSPTSRATPSPAGGVGGSSGMQPPAVVLPKNPV